ncbi:MAG: hypothetical protein LBT23_03855 [Synergistaceae bacterium]|nr:hypothetical protein [Synergistaceae bacterium]
MTVLWLKPEPDENTVSELARAMRKGLGCGSHAEGPRVVLQGDIRERARAWLVKSGVAKVVSGN